MDPLWKKCTIPNIAKNAPYIRAHATGKSTDDGVGKKTPPHITLLLIWQTARRLPPTARWQIIASLDIFLCLPIVVANSIVAHCQRLTPQDSQLIRRLIAADQVVRAVSQTDRVRNNGRSNGQFVSRFCRLRRRPEYYYRTCTGVSEPFSRFRWLWRQPQNNCRRDSKQDESSTAVYEVDTITDVIFVEYRHGGRR